MPTHSRYQIALKSRLVNRLALGVLPLALLAVVGCGGASEEGPERYHISGTVQYEGQPVSSGTVTFTPDSSKENSGPQGVAQIVDGEYNTAADGGKGTIGGPHKIMIATPEFTYQAPQSLDIPKEESQQNFDLKQSEVQAAPPPGTDA